MKKIFIFCFLMFMLGKVHGQSHEDDLYYHSSPSTDSRTSVPRSYNGPFAQKADNGTYEPEFIGETNLLCISESDTIAIPLEKANAKIKSKAGASLYLTGIGSVKTRIHVEGNTSTCIAKPGCEYRLIVRSADNDQDPNSFIQLVRFQVKRDERRCEIGKINTFQGASSGMENLVDYRAKRYGESSYQLFFESVPGEYGIFMSNPNSRDEKRIIIYCFTIQ